MVRTISDVFRSKRALPPPLDPLLRQGHIKAGQGPDAVPKCGPLTDM